MTQSVKAREIFQTACENRYTWDGDFPGYTADLEFKQGGEVNPEEARLFIDYTPDIEQRGEKFYFYPAKFTGQITVKPDLTIEVKGFVNESLRRSIREEFYTLGISRKPNTFEETYEKHEFSLGGSDSTGAVEIFIKEGTTRVHKHEIRDKKIIHQTSHIIHKAHDPRVKPTTAKFTRNNEEFLDTGEGYIPTKYETVVTDSRSSKLGDSQTISNIEETYDKFGGYFLLTQKFVHSTYRVDRQQTNVYTFSNIEFL